MQVLYFDLCVLFLQTEAGDHTFGAGQDAPGEDEDELVMFVMFLKAVMSHDLFKNVFVWLVQFAY